MKRPRESFKNIHHNCECEEEESQRRRPPPTPPPNRRGDFVEDCQSVVLSPADREQLTIINLQNNQPTPRRATSSAGPESGVTASPTQPTCKLKGNSSRNGSKWSQGRFQFSSSAAAANATSPTLCFCQAFVSWMLLPKHNTGGAKQHAAHIYYDKTAGLPN